MVEMAMMMLISTNLPCTSPVLPTKSESTIISLLILFYLNLVGIEITKYLSST